MTQYELAEPENAPRLLLRAKQSSWLICTCERSCWLARRKEKAGGCCGAVREEQREGGCSEARVGELLHKTEQLYSRGGGCAVKKTSVQWRRWRGEGRRRKEEFLVLELKEKLLENEEEEWPKQRKKKANIKLYVG